MAPARRRRRLPTLIDRGLGLLEVVLPVGAADTMVSTLPDGQRDSGGFWFPQGYDRPADIFTPQQRRLQAKQRQVQTRRLNSRSGPTIMIPGSEGTAAADASLSRPHAPPQEHPDVMTGAACGTELPLVDRSLPLPTLSLEADPLPSPIDSRTPRPATFPHGRPPLADDSGLRAQALRGVVDSPKGSD
jgi:hypothetical protein